MKESLRTPLGKVRGLGSAKHGAGHFITQRVSAIGLLFLVPWFLISLIGATRGGYDAALAWASEPLNAVLTLLAVGAALYHMRLGMQVVIEDYVHHHGLGIFAQILVLFCCSLGALVSLLAISRILFAA